MSSLDFDFDFDFGTKENARRGGGGRKGSKCGGGGGGRGRGRGDEYGHTHTALYGLGPAASLNSDPDTNDGACIHALHCIAFMLCIHAFLIVFAS